MGCNIDTLCMGHDLLTKPAQPSFVDDPSDAGRDEVRGQRHAEAPAWRRVVVRRRCGDLHQVRASYKKVDGIWTMFGRTKRSTTAQRHRAGEGLLRRPPSRITTSTTRSAR